MKGLVAFVEKCKVVGRRIVLHTLYFMIAQRNGEKKKHNIEKERPFCLWRLARESITFRLANVRFALIVKSSSQSDGAESLPMKSKRSIKFTDNKAYWINIEGKV